MDKGAPHLGRPPLDSDYTRDWLQKAWFFLVVRWVLPDTARYKGKLDKCKFHLTVKLSSTL